jgi:hypothetical protein
VLTATEFFGSEVLPVQLSQRQPESIHVQPPAFPRIWCDDGDAGNELDLHAFTSEPIAA